MAGHVGCIGNQTLCSRQWHSSRGVATYSLLMISSRKQSSAYASTSRELSCSTRSALGSVEAAALCGQIEEPCKMTYTKMAFFSRTPSSASRLKQLETRCHCFIGAQHSNSARAATCAPQHCCCERVADDAHVVKSMLKGTQSAAAITRITLGVAVRCF